MLVLAVAASTPLHSWLRSVYLWRSIREAAVFGFSADCSWINHSNGLLPPSCYAAFSLSPAAQPPAVGSPPHGHIVCRKVCSLRLPQEKGLSTSHNLRSAGHLPSAAFVWMHWPPPGVDGADPLAKVAAFAPW